MSLLDATIIRSSLVVFKRDLLDFMKEGILRNKYIYTSVGEVYVRHSKRYIQGKYDFFLDITCIYIEDNYRGKGILTELMNFVESEIHANLFIECVHEKRLQNWFIKRGYIDCTDPLYEIRSLNKPFYFKEDVEGLARNYYKCYKREREEECFT